MCDSRGVIYQGRGPLDPEKAAYAADTSARTLAEAIMGADIFLGLSKARVLTGEMVKTMAPQPLILALANPPRRSCRKRPKPHGPTPLSPPAARIIPTRSTTSSAFPTFSGARWMSARPPSIGDATGLRARAGGPGATTPLAEETAAYGEQPINFGPEYLIPKPFEPRLLLTLPLAVAKAAMASGVATRPIQDFAAYHTQLSQRVYRSGLIMRPVFNRAKADPKRVIFAQAEEERMLWAVQGVVDDGLAHPILIGRRKRIEERIAELGLHIRPDRDFELVDPQNNPHSFACTQARGTGR